MRAAAERGEPVLVPASPQEAVEAFGDGDGVTVLSGGTILMPEISYGRLLPERVLMLGRAGLDEVAGGGRVGIGGPGPCGVRCRSVGRALAGGASPADAAAAALDDVDPRDDALASAWYRRRVLPTLVTRALTELEGSS